MVINFGAGPAKIPEEVLKEVKENLINYNGSGLSVMEMSHRSAGYKRIHDAAIMNLREILNVPANYKVLLMQGGGTAMFAAICMNLMGKTGVADYIVTGSWSAKAAKEAAQYGKINMVIPKTDKFTMIPPQDSWKFDSNASYVYYCDNETVDGVEFNFIPETNGVPLVCDMSSNFLSRPFDLNKFGLVFAGAQKNIGTAGIVVVIIREDLINNAMKITPTILDFSIAAKNDSIYNTPPTFIIYVMGCVFKWIKRNGSLQGMYDNSIKKSKLIYDIIYKCKDFYQCPVAETCRSRMNIPFRIGSSLEGDEVLENEFIKLAESEGMIQLKGHRSVGGIRASLYNGVTVKDAETLGKFMMNFYNRNRK